VLTIELRRTLHLKITLLVILNGISGIEKVTKIHTGIAELQAKLYGCPFRQPSSAFGNFCTLKVMSTRFGLHLCHIPMDFGNSF
jgi:hypothetical protein